MTKKHNRINQQDLQTVIASAISTETLRIEAISKSQIDLVSGGAAMSVLASTVDNTKDLTTAGLVDRKLSEMSFD